MSDIAYISVLSLCIWDSVIKLYQSDLGTRSWQKSQRINKERLEFLNNLCCPGSTPVVPSRTSALPQGIIYTMASSLLFNIVDICDRCDPSQLRTRYICKIHIIDIWGPVSSWFLRPSFTPEGSTICTWNYITWSIRKLLKGPLRIKHSDLFWKDLIELWFHFRYFYTDTSLSISKEVVLYNSALLPYQFSQL